MSRRWLRELAGIPDMAVCLGCGYRLRGLSEAVCPECGREFDPADSGTFGLFGRSCRSGWRRRCVLLPGCIIAYTVVCAVLCWASPSQWTFSFRMQGPVLLVSLSLDTLGVFLTLSCLALMLTHPVKPGRLTAVLTIIGFVLWYVCSWVAWKMICGV